MYEKNFKRTTKNSKRQIKGRLEEENKSCENKEKMVIGEKAKSSITKKAEGIA